MKKGFIIGFIIAAFIFGGITYASEELVAKPNPYPVYINGAETTVEAYNINGFTYLKLADMSKAGLEVKFNETLKRIEVTSPIQSKGDENVSETLIKTPIEVPLNMYGLPDLEKYKGTKPKIEDDGKNQYITFEGVKYIRLGWDKNHPPMIPIGQYSLGNFLYKDDGSLSMDGTGNRVIKLVKAAPDGTSKGTVILDNIPYFSLGSMYFIPYDYYINTFLPAIQGS